MAKYQKLEPDFKFDYPNSQFVIAYLKHGDKGEVPLLKDVENSLKEFEQLMKRQRLIVQLEDTPVRAVFDSKHDIQELVFENEFVSLALDGLTDKFTEQQLCAKFGLDMSKISSLYLKD